MDERFSRNIGALTKQEQQKLTNSRIFIAGCGGLGGYAIEYLSRAGVGHITCADDGCFETSDMNRQLLSDPSVIGRKKTDVARERWHGIKAFDIHMDETNLPNLVSGCDLAVDALDNLKTRRSLFAACRQAGIPLIHGAVNGWYAQAAFVPPDGTLYDLLSPEAPAALSVLSFAPGLAASMQAALAVRYLCGGARQDGLHIFNLRTMQYEHISLHSREE